MIMTKTKIIDGVEFTVAPFMAVEALRLKAFLVKTFGPALGQMFGRVIGAIKGGLPKSGDIGDLSLDGGTLAGAVEKLMAQLDEDSFISLIKRLFANLTAKGKGENGQGFMRQFDPANFDLSMQTVFSGRLFSIYPVMLLVLEANYPDFFGKTVRSIGDRIKATATTEPESGTGTNASTN
jgi:hypothetical protein